jgi:phosphate transport system substrate-binding protein
MKKGTFVSLVLALALAGLTLAGCGGAGQQKPADTAGGAKPAATKLRALTAGGSTALQPLVDEAAKLYEQQTGNSVAVQGGGSGTGLSQVLSGAFDIGDSDIFAQEKSGIDAAQLVDHKVAVVGIAPIAHAKAGVKGITTQQLVDIFTGKITNWKDVGGADQKIVVINRAKGSGTRATFEKYGLSGARPVEAQEQDSNGTVVQMVAQTPGAVSYVGFSYFAGNPSLLPLELDGVAPTVENVTTGKWNIWAYEHMYTKGQPDDAEKAFLDFVMSDKVKEIVTKLGYIPGSAMKVERPAK